MRLKNESVQFSSISSDLIHALAMAEMIHQKLTGQEAVVTSLNDGAHKRGSKHYTGDAADLRVWYTDKIGKTAEWARSLAMSLGPSYDVVYGDHQHMNHIHVEYDPK